MLRIHRLVLLNVSKSIFLLGMWFVWVCLPWEEMVCVHQSVANFSIFTCVHLSCRKPPWVYNKAVQVLHCKTSGGSQADQEHQETNIK